LQRRRRRRKMNWLCQFYFMIFFLYSNKNKSLASIKLFNSENSIDVQSYDCIYYINETAGNNETIPYCIRTNQSIELNRFFEEKEKSCENNGIQWSFMQLKQMNISQDDVLSWNSSIELADRYATYLVSSPLSNVNLANEQICNCSSNTFGKFCEYKFASEDTFERTIEYQFYLKKLYRNGSQLWSNMTCYTSLVDCYFGLRCLSWQNICDGKQQCMFGIDEDRCDELELNECEENEYRCEDGSCIPVEYWLDGDSDCSDKRDEQAEQVSHLGRVPSCPLVSSRFDCDEVTEHSNYFACGDGEFILDTTKPIYSCYNFRFSMFFCELGTYSDKHSLQWTLQDGHCSQIVQINKNLTDLNPSEKCRLLLKCLLMNDGNTLCNELIEKFYDFCSNETIEYPEKPIFAPYVRTFYNLSRIDNSFEPTSILFNGTIRCIDSQTISHSNPVHINWLIYSESYPKHILFCHFFNRRDPSDDCSPDKKPLAFYCPDSMECISKHRLRDKQEDCRYSEDEFIGYECFNKKQHRLRCFKDSSSLCLSPSYLGNIAMECSNHDDEYIKSLKWKLRVRKCTNQNVDICNKMKSYIQSSLSKEDQQPKEMIIRFRQYCDTFFDLAYGYDELFCKQWKCPNDTYQCLNGQCISDLALATGSAEWHCSDASNNIRLFTIVKHSNHNIRFLDNGFIDWKMKYLQSYDITRDAPLFTFCNYSIEYGCILANVDNPLNLTLHRPCIPLWKIGDGIIDCYGGLDERNTLTCGKNIYEQRGFDFHCSDEECIPYQRLCKDRCSNNADYLLCEGFKIFAPTNSCQLIIGFDICSSNYKDECDPLNILRSFCDPMRSGTENSKVDLNYSDII